MMTFPARNLDHKPYRSDVSRKLPIYWYLEQENRYRLYNFICAREQ